MIARLIRFGETHHENGTPAEAVGLIQAVENPGGSSGGRVVYECPAIELPWRDNRNNRSCIPTGVYVYEQVDHSPSFSYEHFWVHDEGSAYAAGDRAGVKVHIANFVRQLLGCIAPGLRFVDLDGDGLVDVANSETALNELLDVLPEKTELVIDDREPENAPVAAVEELDVGSLDATIESLSLA